MRIQRTISLLSITAAILAGQSAVPQGWKDFTIGPPTGNRVSWSRFGVTAEGVPMRRLLARAYGAPEHRIVGPAWLDSERYAIEAHVNDAKDFQPLMQQQLAARFHLQARRESRLVPVYVLKQSAAGAPLAAATADVDMKSGGLKMNGSMADFASTLADTIQRPVLDETGLDGKFEISLGWDRRNMASLPTAVKQQLGLELAEDKRMVDLVVVDYIEKLH